MIIEYFYSIKDSNGFIHSIDNVVYTYYIKNYNMNTIANALIDIRKNNNCDGWEKLNCPACSKYSWYQNIVHIGAIHISFGKMQNFDKINRVWDVFPMFRIEVNPNKHFVEKVFQDILAWIKKNCTSGILRKYDYAIDIPYHINAVRVFNSRKEPGLYKGTIYRGQRSQHGFLKIYDKAKEQGIEETPLTRIEHTLEGDKPYSLEKINIINTRVKSDIGTELDNLNNCIVLLCLALQSHGIDFEPFIAPLNYRRRKTIEPYLYDNCIELDYDHEIIKKLLDKVNELFDADAELNRNNTPDSFSGFVEIRDSDELPFD